MTHLSAPVLDPSPLLSRLNLENRHTIAVAVSGGSDSLALLHLAKIWLDVHAPAIRLVAVTVDHGLRAESAEEARHVGSICRTLGVEHRIVTWHQVASETTGGLAARARDARYRLLAEAATALDTDILLLGHTRDDQAETVEMRQARRGSSVGWDRGGAGMATATLFDERIWLLRPLLDVSRQTLRGHLKHIGIAWIDDPTNVDFRFERPRIRALLESDPAGEDRRARLALQAGEAARQRLELGVRAASRIDAFASRVSPGLLCLDPDFRVDDDHEAALYAFRLLLATIGGTQQLPDQARSDDLFVRLATGRFRATLSRTVLEAGKTGIFLRRENRNIGRLSCSETGAIWDGRYRIVEAAADADLDIAACGPGHTDIAGLDNSGAPEHLVRAALSTEPAIWTDGRWLGMARRSDRIRIKAVASPFARYLSTFDLAPAAAVFRLVGARLPPPLPLAEHNKN